MKRHHPATKRAPESIHLPAIRVDKDLAAKVDRTRTALQRMNNDPKINKSDAIRWLLRQSIEVPS